MRTLCLSLIGLGLLVSGYLLLRHFTIMSFAGNQHVDICSALFGTGCDDTLQSRTAVQLGLPLAGWGLIYYGTLASLLLLGWALGDAFQFEANLTACLLCIVAAVLSVVLFLTMATGWAPFCPLCAVVHAVNLAILFPIFRLIQRPAGELLTALKSAGTYLFGAEPADATAARWKLVGFLAVGLVAVALYQWVYVEVAIREQGGGQPFDPNLVLAAFEASPQRDVSPAADDPTLGPSDAPARMVVFSDFQCPGCTRFSRVMTYLQKHFDGELEIVFKHYPLATGCNPSINADFHPRACEAALAAEAAQRQGQFWHFHEALFSNDFRHGEVTLSSIAKRSGLDVKRFETDRRGSAVLAKVQRDVELGTRLGVDGTPAVFLDGRRVWDIRPRSLRHLVADQIRRASK